MAGLDREGGGFAHLTEEAQAWLPADVPEIRTRILDLLVQAAAGGVDPVAHLQQAMAGWFGCDADVMLPAWHGQDVGFQGSGPTLEPLPTLRRPLLWPQRPKRRSDELFSSWLWRVAVAAAAPPSEFARDVLGAELDDVDRDVAPEAVGRLAQVSSQTSGHLAARTLSADPKAAQDTMAGIAEDMMLRHGALLLARPEAAPNGRAKPVLQYCPCCLAGSLPPYFRRSWRFASAVACLDHSVRLYDCCWRCGLPVELLRQRVAMDQLHCAGCKAVFAQAPVTAAGRAVLRQRTLEAMLCYLATQVPASQRACHLNGWDRGFRAPTAAIAVRQAVVAALLPAKVWDWFGTPVATAHLC